MPKRKPEYLPSEPFARWLNCRLAELLAQDQKDMQVRDANILLAAECGWGAASDHGVRKLYRLRKQLVSSSRNGAKGDVHSDTVGRDVVEEALFSAGVPFEDVYPEVAAAEDVVPEPAEWCDECSDWSSPIGGQCPWCDAVIGVRTGQRLLGSRLGRAA